MVPCSLPHHLLPNRRYVSAYTHPFKILKLFCFYSVVSKISQFLVKVDVKIQNFQRNNNFVSFSVEIGFNILSDSVLLFPLKAHSPNHLALPLACDWNKNRKKNILFGFLLFVCGCVYEYLMHVCVCHVCMCMGMIAWLYDFMSACVNAWDVYVCARMHEYVFVCMLEECVCVCDDCVFKRDSEWESERLKKTSMCAFKILR